ncbi:reverse transcriptase domain-containing protein, partial [Tanacetum coccineum]
VPKLPKANIISVPSAWQFMKWGMDIVGPLPEDPGRVWDPNYIITNNGTRFVNDPFKKWAEKLKIQLVSTSVYHPHGNEAVERDELIAFERKLRPGWRREDQLGLRRTSSVNEKTNDSELRLNLDLLEERREIAAIRVTPTNLSPMVKLMPLVIRPEHSAIGSAEGGRGTNPLTHPSRIITYSPVT